MSWYETGFGAIAKEEDRQAAAKMPNTFWMRPSEIKPIVLIDDDFFTFYEHSIKMQGNQFYSPLTCIKGSNPEEPLCWLDLGLKDA